MTKAEQEAAANKFAKTWEGKGYEKGQSQPFWLELLEKVYGVKDPYSYIRFEDKVHIDTNSGFIDGYIDSTHTMIEQKSLDKDLGKPIKQSDGSLLNPFQQAKRYSMELPYSQRPRWIITCNFAEFYIYDMEQPNGEPEIIQLKNLSKEYYRLNFLISTKDERIKKEEEISAQAAEKVAALYNALYKNYHDPTNPHSLKSLNILCVRLVFCAYAEDAGLFGPRKAFENYMRSFEPENSRKALIDLFKVLDTKPENRDPYDDKLNAFPYVNGGLFSDENVEIPLITNEIRDNIIDEFCEFNWSQISPTVFGAMFESTLNPDSRRTGGMHYTSIENIHKVIDPLFLDDLKNELQPLLTQYEISPQRKNSKARTALFNYQNKLASLTFLDPACGSGNFLTETFLCLRHLENTVLEALYGGQTVLADALPDNPIKVSINQLYGIEINDFAVSVAMTALWIAESQTLHETETLLHKSIDYLPLKTNSNIHEGNALRLYWEDVISKYRLNYIMGNPPFVGKKYQNAKQKADMKVVFGNNIKGIGNLDYVTAWYQKAAIYLQKTNIRVVFVSTNSIVQGEQVPLFWQQLFQKYNIHIDFAYRTFHWNNEAKKKAAVHCVIIGFSQAFNSKKKYIFYNKNFITQAKNIHPYLIDMPNIFIENRSKPLFESTPLVYGSFALDNGNYTINEDEYNNIIKDEPNISKYLKLFIGSKEFINHIKRYCIWLKGANIKEVRCSKILSMRVKKVQDWRKQSNRKETVAASYTPMLFAEIRQPSTNYLAIPITSSERRRYVPMGYMTSDVIASNHLLVLPNATLYELGVLISNVHMAWMRTVAGRLKSDYNYSAKIVYNNFPWPSPTDMQKSKIEKTAHGILYARALYPDSSLADLYDETTMPPELRKAHQENDKAVLQAYGFPTSSKKMSESACVAALMKLYQQKVTELEK